MTTTTTSSTLKYASLELYRLLTSRDSIIATLGLPVPVSPTTRQLQNVMEDLERGTATVAQKLLHVFFGQVAIHHIPSDFWRTQLGKLIASVSAPSEVLYRPLTSIPPLVFIHVNEAARMLGVTRQRVYVYIKKGLLRQGYTGGPVPLVDVLYRIAHRR